MKQLGAWLASIRLRLLFRVAFLALGIATAGLAIHLLREEQELALDDYRYGFERNAAQIAATLRHPTGQLALLNARPASATDARVHPVLLPYAALDFDDRGKVQQAIEMAGCLAPYKSGASLCVALGNSPWAGGYVYAAGYFDSPELVEHERGEDDFTRATRLEVTVSLRDQTYRWIAPFESAATGAAVPGVEAHGHLTGFALVDSGHANHPDHDFRGWIWQSARCAVGPGASAGGSAGGSAVGSASAAAVAAPGGSEGVEVPCTKRAFYSMRLPVTVLREALFEGRRPNWPPADIDHIDVSIVARAPGDGPSLFDSGEERSSPRFSLADLTPQLLPGESLTIERRTAKGNVAVAELTGTASDLPKVPALLNRLAAALPLDWPASGLINRSTISTPGATFDLILRGDASSVRRSLDLAAGRTAAFVGAMLGAIFLAWLAIEVGIIHRIARLKARAERAARDAVGHPDAAYLNLNDLRGGDELGILAACLADLLHRVREDAERERNRMAQEKDMWHAVGHEIMSPLQSLLALHGTSDDESSRYVRRMQQAIRVLYGSASPSEAFEAQRFDFTTIDLVAFLRNVAHNARFVEVEHVQFEGPNEPVFVRADEYSLEDVITHILRNADRHRVPGSAIRIRLEADALSAGICIANDGVTIAPDFLDKIFEYGVSLQGEAAPGRRGQGLFVARTYVGKMGGSIHARNLAQGVEFCINMPRSAPVAASPGTRTRAD